MMSTVDLLQQLLPTGIKDTKHLHVMLMIIVMIMLGRTLMMSTIDLL